MVLIYCQVSFGQPCINNLSLASQMNTTLYADDTYLMMSDLDLMSLQNQVNIKVKNIDFWLRKNKLSLNFLESTFLLIHKQPSRTIKSTFKINNIMLASSPIVKYLELFIHQNLNWMFIFPASLLHWTIV